MAALVELEPSGDGGRAALVATLAQAGGTATGPLVAGALAEWAPAPREPLLPGLARAHRRDLDRGARASASRAPAAGRWRLQRPSVPAAIRGPFVRASLTAAAAWSVAALFVSVVPSYAAKLLDSDDLALLGAIAATMLFSSCAGQVLRCAPRSPTRGRRRAASGC